MTMVKDALASDRTIAVASLQSGWQSQKETEDRPAPIHPVITVGRMLRHKELPTGQIEMLLYGLFRARIVAEIPHTPYRKAKVEVLSDHAERNQAELIAARMRRALQLVPGKQSLIWEMRRMANALRGIDATAGRYADAVADASDLSPGDRYALLAEPDVLLRLEHLISLLENKAYYDAPITPDVRDPRMN